MARLKTPPVTVVQGDDAPDIVVTLQQDSSGTPYVLTDKVAYVVIVDTADPESYVAKYEATIEDANAGKVRISWLKDPIELTSYLEDLIPGRRYELQVFLGRTNLPPRYIDIGGYYSYFNGRYYFTGDSQDGSPVFKHATEDLYMSRSPYSGGGVGDYVWLVTSLRAATWAEVKDQDKAVVPSEALATFPIWNYRQIVAAEDALDFSYKPNLDASFEPDATYVITPTAKFETIAQFPTTVSFDGGDDLEYVGLIDERPFYQRDYITPSPYRSLLTTEYTPATSYKVIGNTGVTTDYTYWWSNPGTFHITYDSGLSDVDLEIPYNFDQEPYVDIDQFMTLIADFFNGSGINAGRFVMTWVVDHYEVAAVAGGNAFIVVGSETSGAFKLREFEDGATAVAGTNASGGTGAPAGTATDRWTYLNFSTPSGSDIDEVFEETPDTFSTLHVPPDASDFIGALGTRTLAYGPDLAEYVQYYTPEGVSDPEEDLETRGTQTVLTQIPLIVKPAYRLTNAN